MREYGEGNLKLIQVGPLAPYGNNAYIIADRVSRDAVIVDMPAGSGEVLEAAKSLNVQAVLLTHDHFDHWSDYDLVKAATGAPVLCHPQDQAIPGDKIDGPLEDGQDIRVGGISVRVLHTPGHTPGSVCLVVDNVLDGGGRYLMSGDTLFPGGPGRSATPEDLETIVRSITQSLYALPDDTVVLPGHGETTTVGQSKREYAAFASRKHPPGLCGDVLWESS